MADYSSFSFVTRLERLVDENYFTNNRVDTVIIYGGLNDCWAGSPVGEVKYEGFSKEDLYSYLPALSRMLSMLCEASPETRVICIIDSQLSSEMKTGAYTLAAHYGAEIINLEAVKLQNGHPDKNGMKQIAEQIISYFSDNKR